MGWSLTPAGSVVASLGFLQLVLPSGEAQPCCEGPWEGAWGWGLSRMYSGTYGCMTTVQWREV